VLETLSFVVVCCSVLQRVAACWGLFHLLHPGRAVLEAFLFVAVCCSVLQCIAVYCSVLQCVAVCCSVLQCIVVCFGVLQCVEGSFICCTQVDFFKKLGRY